MLIVESEGNPQGLLVKGAKNSETKVLTINFMKSEYMVGKKQNEQICDFKWIHQNQSGIELFFFGMARMFSAQETKWFV